MELIAEEIVVLLRLDLRLRARPERLHRVQRAKLRLFDLLRALDDLALIVARHLLRRHIHADRIAHIVRIFLHEALELKRIRVVRLALRELLREMDRDRRAARLLLRILNRIAAVARRLPARRLLLARTTRHDRHLLRDHKRRVEAHTKLTDQLLVRCAAALLLRLRELLHERLRARLCNRADVLHDLRTRHTDAAVRDRQRLALLIGHEENLVRLIPLEHIAVRQTLEMELVHRVRRIGNQLTQKDLTIRIDRVDHQIEQLLCLSLKLKCFLRHVIVLPYY